MKKFRLAVMLFLGLGVVISSCKKDEETDPVTTTPAETRCLMSKIQFDDGSASIEYNNNLVSKVTEFDSTGTKTDYSIYSYNNNILSDIKFYENDTMVYKQEYTIENNKIVQANSFSKNDSTGLIEQDNSFNKYFYNSDNKVIKIEGYNQSNLISKYEYTWTNGNISEKKVFYSNGTDLELNRTITYTYDDKKNNLYNIGLFWEEAFSKNNVLKATNVNASDNTTDITEYVYEYNSKDYPTKITTTDSNGNTDVETFTYNCN